MTVLALTDPQDGTVVEADLHANNNAALKTVVNGGLDASNVTAASLTDATLNSPNNSVYRTIAEATGSIGAGGAVANGTYLFQQDAPGLVASGTAATYVPSLVLLNTADYAVLGKTLKLNLRAVLCTNGTALTATLKFGLYTLSSSGGAANSINITVGAVTSGSEVTFTAPAIDSPLNGITSDFDAPATGIYALALNVSAGPTAANSYGACWVSLRMRHV